MMKQPTNLAHDLAYEYCKLRGKDPDQPIVIRGKKVPRWVRSIEKAERFLAMQKAYESLKGEI